MHFKNKTDKTDNQLKRNSVSLRQNDSLRGEMSKNGLLMQSSSDGHSADASTSDNTATAANTATQPPLRSNRENSVLNDMVAAIQYVKSKKEYVEKLKLSVENKLLNPQSVIEECDGILGDVHNKICLMLTAALAAPLNGRLAAPHPGEFISSSEKTSSLRKQMALESAD